MKPTPRHILLIAIAATGLAVPACNTVRGVGEDITEASDATKRAITRDDGPSRSAQGGTDSKNRD